MFNAGKRLTAILLAGAMMVSASVSAFAAGSPTTVGVSDEKAQATVTTDAAGNETVTVTDVKTNKSSVSVPAKIDGHAVTTLGSGALKGSSKIKTLTTPKTLVKFDAKSFAGAKKLKTIKIKANKKVTFSKNALKGLKKSQKKKIVVKINKKMSKKNYKKLVKQLVKAGIKKSNIKRTLKVK